MSIRGILPAVVTPFDDAGRFATGAFELLLDRLYAADVDGVFVCGQTGEGTLQSVEQRKRVAEAAVRLSPPGKTVVVHVGASTTPDAVELTRHACRIGAAAISSLAPSAGYSFPEVQTYYETLAAASDLPVLIYYFPRISAGIDTTEQIQRICEIPKVIGLKFTHFDLYALWLLKRQGLVVLNGHDEVISAAYMMGADGGVGSFYNVAPELLVAIARLAAERKWEEARLVQQRLNEMIRIVQPFPLVPAIKAMLGWAGIDCGPCLAPRRPLTQGEKLDLRATLEKSGPTENLFVVAHRK